MTTYYVPSSVENGEYPLSQPSGHGDFDLYLTNGGAKEAVTNILPPRQIQDPLPLPPRQQQQHQEESHTRESRTSSHREHGRAEVSYVVDQLVDEQQKVLALQEQIATLSNDLSEARSASRGASHESLQDSGRYFIRTTNSGANPPSGDALRKLLELYGVIDNSEGAPMWTREEMKALQCAPLQQLVFLRKKLLASLFGLSDAIVRRRLCITKSRNVQDKTQEENNVIIMASLHRLLGEAFYINSVTGAKELYTLAEGICGIETEVFDAAWYNIREVTDDGLLFNSYEKLQEFVQHPSKHLTKQWRKRYEGSMRKILLAAVINSKGTTLLQTRRKELEVIAREELFHTALLRAVQGRDVVPQSIHCFPPEGIPAAQPCEVEVEDRPSPPMVPKGPSVSSRGEPPMRSPRVTVSPLSSARIAHCRWNPNRVPFQQQQQQHALSRDDTSLSRVTREAPVSISAQRQRNVGAGAPSRRRTAESLGLPSTYTTPRSGWQTPYTQRTPTPTRVDSRATTPKRHNNMNLRPYDADPCRLVSMPVRVTSSPLRQLEVEYLNSRHNLQKAVPATIGRR
ncbi:hypothetical protein DQ04_00281100 [Trypanosoma grayi]|uniref:hypothetical protein n=1 Tax=Trypanosoma grayi TaxID=71804 RepID=UPI0004F43224|nr:hypothetical protein DQ04_00281100 [Trypanosoma grayi]KEG14847.1 hypothetical protein DQ04_00281100 [Trypanosoma grayi]